MNAISGTAVYYPQLLISMLLLLVFNSNPSFAQPTIGIGPIIDSTRHTLESYEFIKFFKSNPIVVEGKAVQVKYAANNKAADYVISGGMKFDFIISEGRPPGLKESMGTIEKPGNTAKRAAIDIQQILQFTVYKKGKKVKTFASKSYTGNLFKNTLGYHEWGFNYCYVLAPALSELYNFLYKEFLNQEHTTMYTSYWAPNKNGLFTKRDLKNYKKYDMEYIGKDQLVPADMSLNFSQLIESRKTGEYKTSFTVSKFPIETLPGSYQNRIYSTPSFISADYLKNEKFIPFNQGMGKNALSIESHEELQNLLFKHFDIEDIDRQLLLQRMGVKEARQDLIPYPENSTARQVDELLFWPFKKPAICVNYIIIGDEYLAKQDFDGAELNYLAAYYSVVQLSTSEGAINALKLVVFEKLEALYTMRGFPLSANLQKALKLMYQEYLKSSQAQETEHLYREDMSKFHKSFEEAMKQEAAGRPGALFDILTLATAVTSGGSVMDKFNVHQALTKDVRKNQEALRQRNEKIIQQSDLDTKIGELSEAKEDFEGNSLKYMYDELWYLMKKDLSNQFFTKSIREVFRDNKKLITLLDKYEELNSRARENGSEKDANAGALLNFFNQLEQTAAKSERK